MKILVLNSGSSSQKSCVYEIGDALPDNPPACLWQGKIEWEGETAKEEIKSAQMPARKEQIKFSSRADATSHLLDTLWKGDQRAINSPSDIDVVGHRVVHGGPDYEDPVLLTADVKKAIAGVSAFAPLHNRAELEGMETVAKLLGDVPQVAVFDTGFHKKMPLAAAVYPGPYEWYAAGIRRYGFHGINHKYCGRRAAHLLKRDTKELKLVSCHLGNGCSLAAVQNGRSVDTTMGFTPLEGLMMGTRSGSVDPGILTYLMRQNGVTGEQLDDILNQKSGLLGISGVSGDMREILAAVKNENRTGQAGFRHLRSPATRWHRVHGRSVGRHRRDGVHRWRWGEFGGCTRGGLRKLGLRRRQTRSRTQRAISPRPGHLRSRVAGANPHHRRRGRLGDRSGLLDDHEENTGLAPA